MSRHLSPDVAELLDQLEHGGTVAATYTGNGIRDIDQPVHRTPADTQAFDHYNTGVARARDAYATDQATP